MLQILILITICRHKYRHYGPTRTHRTIGHQRNVTVGAVAARALATVRAERRSPATRRALLAIAEGDLHAVKRDQGEEGEAARRWAAAKIHHVSNEIRCPRLPGGSLQR